MKRRLPLLAQNGRAGLSDACPLLKAKQTLKIWLLISSWPGYQVVILTNSTCEGWNQSGGYAAR